MWLSRSCIKLQVTADVCLCVSRFLGIPFFHSMMARSFSFRSDISVLVHPEAVLFPDFISTLNYAYELDKDWLLVALLRNVSHFPFYLDETSKQWRREDGKMIRSQEV